MADTDFSERANTAEAVETNGRSEAELTHDDQPTEHVTPDAEDPTAAMEAHEAVETDQVATETDAAADVAERAEAGEEAADLALEEAGGTEPVFDAAPELENAQLEREAWTAPEDAEVDVPTVEATEAGAEAEAERPEDVVDSVDEGPLFVTGPDTDVAGKPQAEEEPPAEEAGDVLADEAEPKDMAEPAAEAEPAEAEAEAETVEAETVEAEAVEAEAVEAEAEPVEEAERSAAEAGESAGDEEPERPRSPFDPPGDWYVIHTYAGYENKVKANLQSRIGSMQMEEKIFDVVIPMEDVMEIKGGKKQVVQKKVFPGYLLVKMIYDNDSWYVVRNTPGVTGFVASGTGTKPTPLSRREVEKILAVKQETQVKPQYRLEWEEGDVVRIVAGPFADFTGTIAEINVEQSKLKVMVNIFDRETPVELAFDQVAKA